MHSKKEYRFDTEAEAQALVDKIKSYNDPSADTYVSGPSFMDIDKIFHSMPWAKEGQKNYWLVTVETYR
jgi:hypothetical protein